MKSSVKAALRLALHNYRQLNPSTGLPFMYVRKSIRKNQVPGVRLLGSAPNARRRWLQAKRYDAAVGYLASSPTR